MIRILYWNINNFSRWKILDDRSDQQLDDSADRENHIVNQVMGANVPDIFVVVEVYSRVREVGAEGTVLNDDGNAGFGVLLLLDAIRQAHGNQWCLVPPLNLGGGGQREGVAVFYNSTKLQFSGPYGWWMRPNAFGQSQPITAATVGGLTTYPANWLDGLPNPTNPIGTLQMNRTTNVTVNGIVHAIPEYQFAGQWQYFNGNPTVPSPLGPPYPNNRIWFPYIDNRGPFLTRFTDLTPGGNNRTINLFAIHTSPATSVPAVNNLALVQEIQNVNAGEAAVIVGDFNVDTFNMNVNGAYTALENLGYEMAIDSRFNNAVTVARRPYCLTHFLPTALATPFNNTGVATDPQHNIYPRYGYMGSMGGMNFQVPTNSGAIDNVFTRYGGGVAGGPAQNITIANTVMGKPYNVVPAPPGVTAELVGGLPYAATLANPIPPPTAAPPAPGGINPPLDTINFPAWGNFGKVHSTSDHLALIIDV